MSSIHYALVSKPGCTPLIIDDNAITNTTVSTDDYGESAVSASTNTSKNSNSSSNNSIRSELTTIYQRYAEMYPNPKLLEEARQRDMLLQAASAAKNYHHQQQAGITEHSATHNDRSNKRSKKGFFSFLFGRGTNDDNNGQQGIHGSSTVGGTATGILTADEEEELIRYIDTHDLNDQGGQQHDDSLCGTKLSIDESCIPTEAYSVARLHLTSTKTRRDHPNALRYGPSSTSSSSSGRVGDDDVHRNVSRPMMVVVGIGEIALFDAGSCRSISSAIESSHHDDDENGDSDDEVRATTGGGHSQILFTSDRDALIEYAQRTQGFSLDAVRGTILSPTCIAISWGFMDGITVFYRRIIFTSSSGRGIRHKSGEDVDFDGWEAVWMLGPSGPVLESMTGDAQDLFHDNDENPGSPLLRVSDCLVLAVEAASYQSLSNDDNQFLSSPSQHNTSALTLALSRLGGYIELVPIPKGLWSGSVLTPENYRRQKQSHPKRKRGQPQPHYAAGRNIACPPQTLALTTLDYQLDIQCLDAFRTCVNSETVWNSQAFPEAPPSEFMLVAAGASKEVGHSVEVLTFWSVSTIFPDDPVDPALDDIGFQLHSSLIEVFTVDSGADVSVFASDEIMCRWRRPRLVQLCDSHDNEVSSVESSQSSRRVTSLSAPAPIVKVRFSSSDGSTSTMSGPFLSVLDWNGGLQVLDCSILGRLVAQNMPIHEYEQLQNQENARFPLASIMISRSDFASELTRQAKSLVGNFDWLELTGLGTDALMPPLVLLLREYPSLVVATCRLPMEYSEDTPSSSCSIATMVKVAFPSKKAAMQTSFDDSMVFVAAHLDANKNRLHSLRYFVMEQLQPVAIVKALARECKYEDAIRSAASLTNYEQSSVEDIIAHCRRHVWMKRRDAESLQQTRDPAFIIQKATSLGVSQPNISDVAWENIRPILKLGLASAEDVGDGKSAAVLRKSIVQLGTFELLCKAFGSTPSIEVFHNDFVIVDVVELATQFSERGDIGALTLLIFRHRREISNKLMSVLSHLPLPLDSSEFCHLLPVVRKGHISDLFIPSNDYASTLPWSHMPRYIFERDSISLVLDLFDEKVVLDFNSAATPTSKGSVSNLKGSIDGLVANWFVSRAKSIQSFLGQEGNVVLLSELGLHCLTPSIREGEINVASPSIQQLYRIRRSSQIFERMLVDGIVSIDGHRIMTADLLSISVADLLDLVLEEEMDASRIISKFQDYVQPLIFETTNKDCGSTLDEELMSFCLKETHRCIESCFTQPETSIALAKRALATSSAISQSSLASFDAQDRLIKDTKVLIEMVFTVVQEISSVLDRLPLSLQDKDELKNCMWTMYESLPLSGTDIDLLALMPEIDDLYRALIRFDICSRWPELKFSYTVDADGTEGVFVDLCKAFRRSIDKIIHEDNRLSCLKDLLSDMKEMNEMCFKSSVPVDRILSVQLVPHLLEKGDFLLLADFLSMDDYSNFKDEERINSCIINFIEDALFSDKGESEGNVAAAIHCLDVIGPLLPKLDSKFQSVRRFLDASHFIASAIFNGTSATPLKPFELKSLSPLDAVEKVMIQVPESVICGSPEWMSNEFALEANATLREAVTTSSSSIEGGKLPVLPGGAIFHLATILQLEDNASVVAVKCRVIHFAMQCRFFGAASAIARTLFSDSLHLTATDCASDASDCGKLNAVAQIVSTDEYTDVLTKSELCDWALCRCRSKISGFSSKAFDKILEVSFSLNVATSRFNFEFQQFPPGRREELLDRPIARLPKHILREYNSDVFRLFNDLLRQTEQGLVHDELVNALSMFHFYWLIFDAQESRTELDEICKADTAANMDLACSLVLHIPSSGTALNCINTLQKTAGDQISAVATEERFQSDNDFMLPDPDLVRRLVGRGYSENASLRAVTMTHSAGYDEALRWAVMHTMDTNFNDPFVILKQNSRKLIDEAAIQLLQRRLLQMEQVLADPSQRSELLSSISHRATSKSSDADGAFVKQRPTTTTQAARNGSVAHGNVDFHTQDSLSKQFRTTKDSNSRGSLVSRAIGPSGPEDTTGLKPTEMSSSQQSQPNPPEKDLTKLNSPLFLLSVPPKMPPVVPPLQSQPKTSNRPLSQAKVATKLNPAPARPAPPLPPPPAVPPPTQLSQIGSTSKTIDSTQIKVQSTGQSVSTDREELRRNGEALRAHLRSQQQTQDSNRRRLIEDGRRLFLQARKVPKVEVSPVVAPPPPPPLLPSATSAGANTVAAPPTQVSLATTKPVGHSTTASFKRAPILNISKKVSKTVAKIQDFEAESNDDAGGWGFDDFDDDM